ncbi:hypothetical protein Dimus_007600 [Dionaea muscipula]
MQPKVDKPVWRRVENKVCDLGLSTVGLQENVGSDDQDGCARLGSQVPCGDGLVPGTSVAILIQNSFDLLNSLDDPDGHQMVEVEGVSEAAIGSAHRDDGQKDSLGARRNLSGARKGGMSLPEKNSNEAPQRKSNDKQPCVASTSGSKLGANVKR